MSENINDWRLGNQIVQVLKIALKKHFKKVDFGECGSNNKHFFLDFKIEQRIQEKDLRILTDLTRVILEQNYSLEIIDPTLINLKNKFKIELKQKWQEQGISYCGIRIKNRENKLFLEDISNLKDLKSGNLDKKLDFFILKEISSAFFLGEKENIQLTRISGFIRENQKFLEQSKNLVEIRKRYDHKIIGKRQEIFLLNNLFGQGFPAWLEAGCLIKEKIHKVVRKLEKKFLFEEVSTPIFGSKQLYEISGHWDNYRESIFPILKVDDEELVLRPMTCPHHVILFKSKQRSYRDLPKRYCESSRLFRYEASGALSGLERVRMMELTEGHIFLTKEQIEGEIKLCFEMINSAIDYFGIKIDHVALSTRGKHKEGFHGSDKLWDKSQKLLEKIIKDLGVEYKIDEGGAAFYGPKIDIQIKNFLGKIITLSTIQLDYYLPQQFGAKFTNKNGNLEECVIIHRGLLGTYERFISILLEQYRGDLPFWFNPRQVIIIPTSIKEKDIVDYAKGVYKKLKDIGIIVKLDLSEERLAKKILFAQEKKYKFTLVIGQKELEEESVSERIFGDKKTKKLSFKDFLNKVVNLSKLTDN